jgi:hypothetical protein
VERERILERERRWAVPAGLLALAPLVLYIASIIIVQGAHISGGNSEAAQLTSLHDHAGTVLVSAIVRGLGFLLLPLPILYLFLAAKARNPRVQAAMVGFVFLGPILFGIQGVVQAVGAGQAADHFVQLKSEHFEGKQEYPFFRQQLDKHPDQIEKVTVYTAENAVEVEQTNGDFYAVKEYPSKDESRIQSDLDAKGVDNESNTDTGARPPDALATKTTDDNGVLQASQGLLLPAVLGLIVMMVYIPLQSLRAGLLSRFLGSLGIALGASMILILPVAIIAMLAWTGFLGLVSVGRVPGGRPPAWDAGEAVPLQRPGQGAATRRGGETIEGDATEVDADGEGSPDTEQPAAGRPKRKRKRRT